MTQTSQPQDFNEQRRGLWHLSTAPQTRLPGVLLRASDGRLTLQIEGELGDTPDVMPEGSHRIIGELNELQSVVLEGCFVRGGPAPFARAPLQTWHVGEALFGVHCAAGEAFGVRGADFELVGATTWAHPEGTDVRSLTNGRPDPLPLWTHEDTVVDLVRRVRSREINEARYSLESPMTLRVRSRSNLTRTELHDRATRPLQALLGLATGKYSSVMRRFIVVPQDTDTEDLTPPLEWWTLPLTGDLTPERDRCAFLYAELNHCSLSLQRIYEQLRAWQLTIDLYLAALRESGYAEVGFNLVAQALESYHRLQDVRAPLPTPLWDDLRRELALTVEAQSKARADTPQLRDAYALLTNKLTHLNQISFRDRLRILLDGVGTHVEVICGESREDFLTSVVQTRNFYVHWDRKSGSRVVRGAAAVALKSRLLALLEISMLNALGFPPNAKAYEGVLYRRVSWLDREHGYAP